MKKVFTQEQIVSALRQAEGGTTVVEVCRKLGVTEQTFYRWKRKFSGMGIAELRRLKQLEEENAASSSLRKKTESSSLWSQTYLWTSTCSRR